jgi:hypothetical protein
VFSDSSIPNRFPGRAQTVSYYETVTDEIIEAAPVPEPSAVILDSGPHLEDSGVTFRRVRENNTTVDLGIGCEFGIQDDNNNYWTWTYDARLYGPNGNLLGHHTDWHYAPAFEASFNVQLSDPPEGTYKCTVDWWVETYQLPQRQATKDISYMCPGDIERTKIRKEYSDYAVNLDPECADFSDSRHATHFSFNELDTGDYSVALIRDPLIVGASSDGLESWRSNYGGAMVVNSAFRNPERNENVGGATQSRHMYGDAADIATAGDHDVWNDLHAAAANANADYIEPVTGPCGWACVHGDWRAHSGGYQ